VEKKKRIRRTKQELIASGYYKDKAEKAKKPKIRHRRTKQELIASGYYKDKNKDIKETSNVKVVQKHSRDKYKITKGTTEKTEMKQIENISVERSIESVDNVLNKKVELSSNAFKTCSMTAETLSERQINKAKEQGLENWEHDLRNDYERGNIVYYVEINPYCHTKELIDCKVRTVYAKSMICTIEDGECRVIGIEDIDKVFATKKDATRCYKHISV
jgi:hypothetical protein